MVEGMEPAQIGEQAVKMMGEREGIRRDTTGFYGEGHDFSIVLYKKEKKAGKEVVGVEKQITEEKIMVKEINKVAKEEEDEVITIIIRDDIVEREIAVSSVGGIQDHRGQAVASSAGSIAWVIAPVSETAAEVEFIRAEAEAESVAEAERQVLTEDIEVLIAVVIGG